MRRYRCRITSDSIHGSSASLSEEETHYLRHVLRLKVNDTLELFDGQGNTFRGRIAVLDTQGQVEILSQELFSSESPLRSVLALALLKGEKFEWVLQKATELGITEILPFFCRHCEVTPARQGQQPNRHLRWQKIVEAATRQCGRSRTPLIHPVTDIRTLIARMKGNVREADDDNRMATGSFVLPACRLALLERGGGPLLTFPSPLASLGMMAFVGPEGGWDVVEEAGLRETCCPVSLGPRILRSETAAVAVAVLMQTFGGDFSGILPVLTREDKREDSGKSDSSDDDRKGNPDREMPSEPAIQKNHLDAHEG